jgi:hypothetical protein
MNNLEIYIVCHNRKSYELFKENNKSVDINKFKFILVGDEYNWRGESFSNYQNKIIANFLPDNIERHKSLLTFTAWYALIKNNLINTEYVGVFEYDCILKRDIFEIEKDLNQNKLIGFYPVSTTHLYLDLIPEFSNLLPFEYVDAAMKEKLWIASTNMILPVWFMAKFVDWYLQFIPEILQFEKHPHYHERAVNVFAAVNGIKGVSETYYEQRYLIHQMLRSHKIKLQK